MQCERATQSCPYVSPKIWAFLWIWQILLWLHAICISKGCIQICEPLGTFNTVLTCASNHPQNILHASPPSPDVLSCIHAACISALLNYTHIMQNIYQTFTNIHTTHHLGIYSTLYSHHPKIPKYLYCKRSCTGTCSSIHLLPSIWPFCSQPLMFSINFRSIAKDSYPPPPFSEMNRCLIFF